MLTREERIKQYKKEYYQKNKENMRQDFQENWKQSIEETYISAFRRCKCKDLFFEIDIYDMLLKHFPNMKQEELIKRQKILLTNEYLQVPK